MLKCYKKIEAFLIRGASWGRQISDLCRERAAFSILIPSFVIQYGDVPITTFPPFSAKKNHEAVHSSSNDGLRGFFANDIVNFKLLLQLPVADKIRHLLPK